MAKKFLAIGAHPDDIEIGCGGTIYKLIKNGWEGTHLYVTSGDAGSQTIPAEELVQVREAEAKQAAEILGVKDVRFLREQDGLTMINREAKLKVIDIIRDVKPEIVFVHTGEDKLMDHNLVYQMVGLSALHGSMGPWFQETTGTPWTVPTVLGYEVWNPINNFQLSVDITDTMDIKLKSLKAYGSQMGEETKYDEAFEGMGRYRGVMSFKGKYAEVFQVLKMGEQLIF